MSGYNRKIDEATLRERTPEIPWDVPVPVIPFDLHTHLMYACRICIALENPRGRTFPALYIGDRDTVVRHIKAAHA